MGDNRTYEYMCLLRAITSEDGMTYLDSIYDILTKKAGVDEKVIKSLRNYILLI